MTEAGPSPAFADGLLGSSLSFAGRRDFVTGSAALQTRLDLGRTNDFSMAFWLRAAAGYSPQTADSIVSARYGKTMWFIALRPGAYHGVYLRHYDGKASTDIKPAANQLPRITDGDWHHLAFTSDRDGQGIVYLDGQSVGSRTIASVSGRANYTGATEFSIGASVNAFRGSIDDPAIWKVALTPEAVKAIYLAGFRERKDLSQIARPPGDLERHFPATVRQQLAALRRAAESIDAAAIPAPPTGMVAFDSAQPQDLRVHVAGSYRQLGRHTRRGLPGIVIGPKKRQPEEDSSGRLELARWLVDPRHPLTARVIVNRVWQHHFGAGLVRTPGNFGWLGERPSHPGLLDWLAHRFIADGWSLKQLHRRILLSATWQQSSAMNPASHAIDSGNLMLWRMNRRRLEAESIRDTMLNLSGDLDRTMFGTFQTWQAKMSTVDKDNRKTARYDTSRRSIYLPVIRDSLHPLLALFDFGDPNSVTPSRTATTVAPQALFMMNSEFVHRQAGRIARRLTMQHPDDPTARIHAAYDFCFARPPTATELRRAEAFIARQANDETRAWTLFCQGIFSMNEFIHVN